MDDQHKNRPRQPLGGVHHIQRQPHITNPSTPHVIPPIKQGKFKRMKAWVKKHPKKTLLLVVVLLALIGGGIYATFNKETESAKPAKQPPVKEVVVPKKYYSPLTGVEVSEADSKLPVIAVMIENSPDARPQSGIAEAGVVFESVAEGGITRFMVLYQEGKPHLIGPVRSVRPQFASWVAAFDAGLAHVGGSDIPLKKLRSGKIKDLDQFFNAASYYRSNDRYAPHNVYTSYGRLLKLVRSKGYTSSDFTAWPRIKAAEEPKAPSSKKKTNTTSSAASAPAAPEAATTINVPVSTGLFSTQYRWNPKTKLYRRLLAGTGHKDREEGQIQPSVVVVLRVVHDAIRDSNGYSYPNVNTSGKAWIFQNGVVQAVRWSKASDKQQISFKDDSGKEVELAPGQTWVAAIRPGLSPSW